MQRRGYVLRAVLFLIIAPAMAQTSTSFKLTEAVFNAGGRPLDSAIGASASFHVRLDAIGEAANTVGLSSASFHADIGFVGAYRPPGEALGLRFANKVSLTWNPERSVGHYNLYRDLISTLPGTYGTCLRSNISGESWSDATTPPAGRGWFYLVTARNRLDEEGTKGSRSDGTPRPNPAPCP